MQAESSRGGETLEGGRDMQGVGTNSCCATKSTIAELSPHADAVPSRQRGLKLTTWLACQCVEPSACLYDTSASGYKVCCCY